jgi:hypothetical protein
MEFRIKTKYGYFVEPEKIGSYSFPLSVRADYRAATVYFGKLFAKKSLSFHKIKEKYDKFAWVEECS